MRVVDALKELDFRREVLDPSSARFLTGTPKERDQARREWFRHKQIQRILDTVQREIPRSELVLGRHWIEHAPTGDFYEAFAGDPEYAPNLTAYYVGESGGDPVMLQPYGHPANRAELERMQAAKQQRRVDHEAAVRQRREQMRAAARGAT